MTNAESNATNQSAYFSVTSKMSRLCSSNSGGNVITSLEQLSTFSIVCRICYDNEKDEPLISPCRCSGTVAFVHRTCLETWLAESNSSTCELCHQHFKTIRTLKYTSFESLWKWLRLPSNAAGTGRGLRGDILAYFLVTPIVIIITYICLFSSDYYNQKKFSMMPAARWTSISLFFMIGIMLIGYYLWVNSTMRQHARIWYNWWQRECTVRYIPQPGPEPCQWECLPHLSNPNNTPTSGPESDGENDANVRTNRHRELELYRGPTWLFDRNDKVDIAVAAKDSTIKAFNVQVGISNEEECAATPVKNEGRVYIINIIKGNDAETEVNELRDSTTESSVEICKTNFSDFGMPTKSKFIYTSSSLSLSNGIYSYSQESNSQEDEGS